MDQDEMSSDKGEESVIEQKPAGPENGGQGGFVPRQVFVVISKREDLNADCLQVVRGCGIEPIVLNDQDQILSVTEMINRYRRVGFALILLAGDDFVYDRLLGKPGEAVLGAKPEVVFFFGYLLAKLGNAGTMALYREQKSFRLPVGIQHGVFVPYEKNGNWKSIFESKLKMLKIL